MVTLTAFELLSGALMTEPSLHEHKFPPHGSVFNHLPTREETEGDAIHYVNSSLVAEQIEKMTVEYPRLRDFPYFESLSEFNGCSLFFGAVSLYGFRTSFDQTPVEFVPFDIRIEDFDNEDFRSEFDSIIFGSADWNDNSFFYMQSVSGKIIKVDRDDERKIMEWNSFGDFIVSEILFYRNLLNEIIA